MEIKISVVLTADPLLLSALQALSIGKASSAGPSSVSPKEKTTKKTETETPIIPIDSPAPALSAKSTPTFKDTVVSTSNGAGAPSGHSLESLRAIAVPLSKAGHKDVIKSWISDHGYKSLQDLQPTHFDEFYGYLQTLKA
jgi:hypothetical protein